MKVGRLLSLWENGPAGLDLVPVNVLINRIVNFILSLEENFSIALLSSLMRANNLPTCTCCMASIVTLYIGNQVIAKLMYLGNLHFCCLYQFTV
jgi:hypothetical protein